MSDDINNMNTMMCDNNSNAGSPLKKGMTIEQQRPNMRKLHSNSIMNSSFKEHSLSHLELNNNNNRPFTTVNCRFFN